MSQRRLDFNRGHIELNHGSGGLLSYELIEQLFLPAFHNPWLALRNDQANVPAPTGEIVVSTDSHVVSPLFFPGGNIGSLALHGSVNDIAMAGGSPLYLTVGFILEEGLSLRELKTIVETMAEIAHSIPIAIISGDTKVVERGKGDGVFITSTAIGQKPKGVCISAERARPGDDILISGPVATHGMAVLSAREPQLFQSNIVSDSAPLHSLVARMLDASQSIHCLRDPTRGGLASTLHELARQSQVGFLLEETDIPINPEVQQACELLGIDPLHVANEGILVAICPASETPPLLNAMRQHPLGANAKKIGVVTDDPNRFVQLRTSFGGVRLIDWLTGEPLPRIC